MHEVKKKERFSTLLGLTIFKDKNYLVLGATTFGFSAPFGASVAFVALAGAVEHPPEPQELRPPSSFTPQPEVVALQEEPHDLLRNLPPSNPPRHPASAELTLKATAKTKTERYFIFHSFEKSRKQTN